MSTITLRCAACDVAQPSPDTLRCVCCAALNAAPVAALFVRADSVYKVLPGVDAYDAQRDARTFPGSMPVVAHPPCRGWGRLRQFASKVRHDEKALGPWAVAQVRECGGVLEHPRQSTLWDQCGLPIPGAGCDAWGGFTIEVDQYHFGHRAQKRTWLYIVPKVAGCVVPFIAERGGEPTHCVRPTKHYPRLPSITKAEREHTPPELSRWLVSLARACVGIDDGYRMQTLPDPGPRVWNQDPRLTGDAHRLLKSRIQLAVIASNVPA